MKHLKRFILVMFVLVATAPVASAQQMVLDVGAYIQAMDNGRINWDTGLVTAVGIGAPPEKAVNMAQARAMARRAATVVARRNLLEIIKGVQIDSATTVENYIVTNDVILSQVNGFLQNSQILDTAYMSDGSVEVTVGINLRGGFAQVLIPERLEFKPKAQVVSPPPPPVYQPEPAPIAPAPIAPAPEPTPEKPSIPSAPTPGVAEAYTGLVVDARGLGARPAMSPKVLDENGVEVYGSAFVSREYAIQHGMAGYAKDIDKAVQQPRVADKPFVAKAMSAGGKAKTDLVISNEFANKLRGVGQTQSFLEKCRVMIVLD
ncbi:MAG: hypothetical protein EOM25_06670 [Deltaproteobacteria bacterium]|nr:hypothetical protein [Deltaproteobacteria bacterium]